MNKLLALLVAFSGAWTFAVPAQQVQTELTGFLDIPWGADQATAKEQVKTRAAARLQRQESTADKLRFEGGKFGGLKVQAIELRFMGGKFYWAEVLLDPVSKDHSKEFAALRTTLAEKYGAPTRDNPSGPAPTSVWYFAKGAGISADELSLIQNPQGPGLKLLYRSAPPKAATAAPNPVAPATPTAKPSKELPVAKGDL